MKGLLFILGIFVVVVSVQCKPSEEMKEMFKKCKEEAGMTEDDKDRSDPRWKCVKACIMTGMGVMVDGKVVADKAWDQLKKMKSDIDDSKKEPLTKCAETANELTDKCATAASFKKCCYENDVFPKRQKKEDE